MLKHAWPGTWESRVGTIVEFSSLGDMVRTSDKDDSTSFQPHEWCQATNGYWYPLCCLEPIADDGQVVGAMKPAGSVTGFCVGDKARVRLGVDLEPTPWSSRRVGQVGVVTALGRREYINSVPHECVMFSLAADGQGNPPNTYWMPAEYLEPVESGLDAVEQTTKPSVPEPTRKDNMALYRVTITQKPSVKAQENGEVEKIIVAGTQVIAVNETAAAAVVAVANADAITKLGDQQANLTVRVINEG